MHPIDFLRQRIEGLSQQAFLQRYPSPVLVATGIIGGRLGKSPSTGAAGRAQRIKPTTLVHIEPVDINDPCADDILVTRRLQREMWVPIAKSATTPRDAPITVGRYATCDVVLNDYTISKRHACIQFDPLLKHFRLTDAGSTNGTRVGDIQVPDGATADVRSGDVVVFGRLIFLILSASDFFAYLHGRSFERSRPVEISVHA